MNIYKIINRGRQCVTHTAGSEDFIFIRVLLVAMKYDIKAVQFK